MNIEFFTDSYLPGVGGTENVVVNLCKTFKEQKHSVAVACPKYKTKEKELGFPVFRCKSLLVKKPQSYCAFSCFDKNFKKQIKDFNPSIIHAHSVNDMLSRAIKLGKELHVPVVATIHTKFKDCWLKDSKSHLITACMLSNMKKLLKKVDMITTVSYFMKEVLKSYGITKNIEVVRNGCAKEKCQNLEILKQQFKQKFKIADDTLVFLSVGRVERVKNLEFTLNMLSKFKDYNSNFVYYVAGMGNAIDYYKKLTKQLSLENNVKFLGFVMDDELELILARSDLLLFTNTFDTDGLVVAESACYQTPSVVLANSGSAERVLDGKTGFVVENNQDSYLAKMISITSNKNLLKTVSQNAFNTIPNTWQEVSKDYFDLYQKLLNQKKDCS